MHDTKRYGVPHCLFRVYCDSSDRMFELKQDQCAWFGLRIEDNLDAEFNNNSTFIIIITIFWRE